MRPIYQPDSLASSRYGINPFQRIELNIGGVDRTNAEFFPTFEGEELYVERCDFPVLFTLVGPSSGVATSFVAATGKRLRAPFKGIYIAHPLLSPTFAGKFSISLIISKHAAGYDNSLGDQSLAMLPAFRMTVNTGATQNMAVYVPPGARRIRSFQNVVTATGLTQAFLNLVDQDGVTVQNIVSISQLQAGAVVAYNQAAAASYALKTTAMVIASQVLIEAYDIMLPSNTRELLIGISGTTVSGLGQACNLVFT